MFVCKNCLFSIGFSFQLSWTHIGALDTKRDHSCHRPHTHRIDKKKSVFYVAESRISIRRIQTNKKNGKKNTPYSTKRTHNVFGWVSNPESNIDDSCLVLYVYLVMFNLFVYCRDAWAHYDDVVSLARALPVLLKAPRRWTFSSKFFFNANLWVEKFKTNNILRQTNTFFI